MNVDVLLGVVSEGGGGRQEMCGSYRGKIGLIFRPVVA